MKEGFYGSFEQTRINDDAGRHAEEIAVRGFTIIPDLLSPAGLTSWRQKIDDLYNRQESEFGRQALMSIQELDVCRAPLLYDWDFVGMAAHPRVLAVVQRFLGDWFILNLQNAVINRPGTIHHQSSWHRDLPYHNAVSSRPLGINAMLIFDEFSFETGGTHVLPYSHKAEVLPSDAFIENNQLVVNAPAGSAVAFDCMLFHRAGSNRSQMVRRAVNHLYTVPMIKQQYDFPRALGALPDVDPAIARLLGYTSQVPLDDKAWRKTRAGKMQGSR
jgi:ectoine hydroxylase-related dioxygenase (phytanoyl-CoA dioxygenase family)